MCNVYMECFELGVEVLKFEKNVLEPKLHGF